MRYWMMVLGVLLLAPPLSAQVVSGRVSDTRGRPVSFATVTVLDAEGMAVGHAQTDASGTYTATVGSASRFRVRAEASGYRPVVSRLAKAAQGRTVRRHFTLRQVPAAQGRQGGLGRTFPAPGPAPTPAVPPIPGVPRVPR